MWFWEGSHLVDVSHLLVVHCRWLIKVSFSFINLSHKTLKWPPYILICHCTSLSPWFIILDKNNFVKVDNHYLTPGGNQVCLYAMPWEFIGMYYVKCYHYSYTSLNYYVHILFCLMVIRPWIHLPLVVMAIWFAWVILG